MVACLTPVRSTLTEGSLAKAVVPVSTEREPNTSAESNSPRGMSRSPRERKKEEVRGVPAGNLLGHPRHQPTTRVSSQGPKVTYKRAPARSAQAKRGTDPTRTGTTFLN